MTIDIIKLNYLGQINLGKVPQCGLRKVLWNPAIVDPNILGFAVYKPRITEFMEFHRRPSFMTETLLVNEIHLHRR